MRREVFLLLEDLVFLREELFFRREFFFFLGFFFFDFDLLLMERAVLVFELLLADISAASKQPNTIIIEMSKYKNLRNFIVIQRFLKLVSFV